MKLLLVIDHFGSGGAQRQMVELACGLKRRGHNVEFFIFYPKHDFFRSRVKAQKIVVHEYSKVGRLGFGVVFRLASLIRSGGFDAVVSYLNSPNVYAELVNIIFGSPPLVVSERTSHHDDKFQKAVFVRRLLHGFADHVVTNSVSHCIWLRKKRWLKNKVSCIYNGIDLEKFRPVQPVARSSGDLRLLGIGRIGPEKNVLTLLDALALFHKEYGYVPEVSWAGRGDESAAGRAYCRQIDDMLAGMPEIGSRWHWLGEKQNVSGLLHQHHALVHPSNYEGLPNVVCEALAAGVPVLASDVCDHPLLVAEGERGFLFDQTDPASIAGAIGNLHKLDDLGRARLAINARRYAEAKLSSEKMVVAYENMLTGLLGVTNGSESIRD